MKTDVNMSKAAFAFIKHRLELELEGCRRMKKSAGALNDSEFNEMSDDLESALKDTIAFVEMRKGVV